MTPNQGFSDSQRATSRRQWTGALSFCPVYALLIMVALNALIAGCKRAEHLEPGFTSMTVNGGLDDSVRTILGQEHRSAIIRVRGRCVSPTMVYPALTYSRSNGETHGAIPKLLDTLKGNPNLQIAESPNGILTVSVNRPTQDLEAIRIHKLTLDPIEQYNPTDALIAALNSPEMSTYMQAHGIEVPPLLDGLRAVPSEGSPHLDPLQENLTIADLELKLLKVFPGLVLYEECGLPNGHRLILFEAERIAAVKQ